MPEQNNGGVLTTLRRHPVIVGVMIGFTLLGVVLGLTLLGEGWTLTQRLVGGALAGIGAGLCVVTPRIIG